MNSRSDPVRVLVIEDDPTSLELAVAVLECDGYQVQTATTAEEGLRLAAGERPAVILMDLYFRGGMGGHEATRRLKANPATATIPIVALTAWATRGEDQKALEAGCDAYLTKPLDAELLRDTIRGFLAGPAG